MNLKACLIGFLLVLNSITAISQQIALSEEESKDLRIKVVEKSNNITSIISDFIQYKQNEKIINFEEIFPLQITLAKKIKCSTRTVQRFFRKLKISAHL